MVISSALIGFFHFFCLFAILIIYSIDLLQFFMLTEKIRGSIIDAALSVRQSARPSVRLICVRPITSLFEVRFRSYFTEMTTMLTMCRAQYLGPFREGEGHCETMQQNRVRLSKLRYLKVFFKNISQK